MIILALTPPLIWLLFVSSRSQPIRPTVFEDDAYYYLGIARNIVEGNGSTFTGMLSTNGYHPLWMAVVVIVTAVARDPQRILMALVVVQGLLWIWSVLEFWRIGGILRCREAAFAATAAYGVLTVLSARLAFNGMESALVMPLLLATVRVGLVAWSRPPEYKPSCVVRDSGAATFEESPTEPTSRMMQDDLRLGGLLAMVCLARLDALFVAVPIGLVLLFRDSQFAVSSRSAKWGPGHCSSVNPVQASTARHCSWRLRRALCLAGPAIVVLTIYLILNWAIFGSATPVSGRAKGLATSGVNLEPLMKLLGAGTIFGHPMFFGGATGVMVIVACLLGRKRKDGRRVLAFVIAMIVGQLGLTSYLVLGTSYTIWPWYNYIVPVVSGLATLVLVCVASERVGISANRACVGLAFGFVIMIVAVLFRPEAIPLQGSLDAAKFVRTHLDSDAVLAMGDRAGMFGYLADRPLLHLEGLVGDAELLGVLKDRNLTDRMIDLGIDYYVSSGASGTPIVIRGRSCHVFQEPVQHRSTKQPITVCDDQLVYSAHTTDGPFTIWEFDPEINAG